MFYIAIPSMRGLRVEGFATYDSATKWAKLNLDCQVLVAELVKVR